MKHQFYILPCILLSLCTSVWAEIDAALLSSIKSGNPTQEQWVEAMLGLKETGLRPSIESAINSRKPYPKEALVSLLSHPKLAVRLGAIEMLEDATGSDKGFNAWVKPAPNSTTAESITQWQQWAKNDSTILDQKSSKLSQEKIHNYIQQLLSNDPARIARATRMLEGDNFNAVATIQQFLTDNPNLPAAKLAHLKQAQYQLVLIKADRSNAPRLAHDLILGSRDQKISALARLKRLGLITIPIIREYIDLPDPLIRETAIDAVLTVGGAQTLPFITERLKQEKDINVIHIAIKKLKNIGGKQSLQIVSSYLDHEDEDLVIASVSAISSIISGVRDSHNNKLTSGMKGGDAVNTKIMALLKDTRWRVRVAALNYAKKMELKSAKADILHLLEHDKDEFVRHNAIATSVALKFKAATATLHKLYLKHDDMIPSLTHAIIEMDGSLPADLLAHLKTRDADTIITSIKSFSSSSLEDINTLIHFSKSNNLDIACAALRFLSNDDSKTKKSSVANILTDAINSKQEAKIEAILNSLELPNNAKIDPRLKFLKDLPNISKPRGKTSLDPLYNAFLMPGGKPLTADLLGNNSPTAIAKGGIETFIKTIIKLAQDAPTSERAFQIALKLNKVGDARGLQLIEDNISKMPISKRAALVASLYNPRRPEATAILLALLQDPSADIRATAIKNAFSNDKNKVLIQRALESIAAPGSRVSAANAYSYRTENAAKQKNTQAIFHHWCSGQLSKKELDDQARILSLILFRKIAADSDSKLVVPFTKHKNQWVRRAAWHTLGIMNATWLSSNADKILADPSPDVRVALADAYTLGDSAWKHFFNDVDSREEASYYSRKSKRILSSGIRATLEKMAQTDPSEQNRFEAMFTLLSHSATIDLENFISLIPKQPKSSKVTARLSDLVEDNYRSMGKGMRPLLAYIDFKLISRSYHPKILAHFSSESPSATKQADAGFSTFKGLAKNSNTTSEPQHITPEKVTNPDAIPRKKLIVIFFEKAGCKKCEQVESYLNNMKQDFNLLEIKRHYVDKSEGITLNQHLSNKFLVPSTQVLKAPAIFTSHGFLVGSKINPKDLSKLLSNTMETPEQPDWFGYQSVEEKIVVEKQVDKKYRDLTLPIVIFGGLLDGINPCAFATIIFFLSYLTIAKRSAKEIFFVGFAFILAVFLSYLSFGLIFNHLLKYLTENSEYQWIRSSLNYVFAGFAILVAVLSLRDWWRARQGRIGDMTLQLPSFLKKKIRSVIRENSKSSLYVLAAFLSGIAISLLELACTGQVYAPIIYQINKGNQDATTMLVIYNLAFVLPLIVIFGLAMTGMKSNSLINFQKNHTATIKLLTALLFFLLAAVLLFSGRISLWIEQFYPAVG